MADGGGLQLAKGDQVKADIGAKFTEAGQRRGLAQYLGPQRAAVFDLRRALVAGAVIGAEFAGPKRSCAVA